MRATNYSITLNNPTTAETAKFRQFSATGDPAFQYFLFQLEKTPTGPPHYQGYLELKKRQRLTWLIVKFGTNRIHWEKRERSQANIIAYCKKVDSRVIGGLAGEWGSPKVRKQGTLGQMVEAVNDGRSLEWIREEYPVQAFKHDEKLVQKVLKVRGHRCWPMDVKIFVGASGVGKSYEANRMYPDAYRAPWPTGKRWWWPGYEGEKIIIMDEFRNQVKIDQLMDKTDRHASWCEYKFGNVPFTGDTIIITTNIDPKKWYPKTRHDSDGKLALQRRLQEFAEIYDFTNARKSIFPPHLPEFTKVKRTEVFKFDPIERVGFGTPVVTIPRY